MTKTIATSVFGTVPVVAFHRLHVETKEPISFHAIVFTSVDEAKATAHWIERQSHLELIGITDATFDDSRHATCAVNIMPTTRTEYGRRLDQIHARIAERLGEKPFVAYSAYEFDSDDMPIDNLADVAIPGNVQFHAKHDPYWGEGKPYTSPAVNSPTWLDVSVLADEMIKTTGDYHHQFLESVVVIDERDGLKIARFSMGS